jgi:peroxiredoxin
MRWFFGGKILRSIIQKLLPCCTLIALLIAACGSDENGSDDRSDIHEVSVKVNVVGQISTPTAVDSSEPEPTHTPSPTPIQWATLVPTPRKVTVTRINDTVDPIRPLQVTIGDAAPPITLIDIDGNTYVLNELLSKTVIVNFWTVGCGSCFFEFPIFQHAYAQYSQSLTDSTDELLILSVNVSDLVEETRQLGESLGVTFPLIVDPQGEVFMTHFGGAVVPTTIFIGSDGKVAERIIGPLDFALLTSILDKMGLHLAQQPLG